MNMLSKMILLATQKHDGQVDHGGRPYILHCLAVMHKLRTDDEELMCIAVGHDLIEDTDVTGEMLREMGFSPRVVLGIENLTKWEEQTYQEYKARVLSNRDAMIVKQKDLLHNSDLRRLKGVREKDLERTARYVRFYYEIEEVLRGHH
jgi:GTP diphosphokinase / guanosine-3',5'-bis(diphosphate) 3'-diphosphatase